MVAKPSDKIASALFDALGTADPDKVVALRTAVSEYESRFSRTYNGVRRQPFCRNLLDAIVEAGDLAGELNRFTKKKEG